MTDLIKDKKEITIKAAELKALQEKCIMEDKDKPLAEDKKKEKQKAIDAQKTLASTAFQISLQMHKRWQQNVELMKWRVNDKFRELMKEFNVKKKGTYSKKIAETIGDSVPVMGKFVEWDFAERENYKRSLRDYLKSSISKVAEKQ